MDDLKTKLLFGLYVAVALVALPIVLLWIIGCVIVYAVLKFEKYIVSEIWEDDLAMDWNKFVGVVSDFLARFGDDFLKEMEL
jgi:hypothetical protein